MTKVLSLHNSKLIVNDFFFVFVFFGHLLLPNELHALLNISDWEKKFQSIAYILSGSEQVYWILGLEVEVHSTSILQSRWSSRILIGIFFSGCPCPYPISKPRPKRTGWGCLACRHEQLLLAYYNQILFIITSKFLLAHSSSLCLGTNT